MTKMIIASTPKGACDAFYNKMAHKKVMVFGEIKEMFLGEKAKDTLNALLASNSKEGQYPAPHVSGYFYEPGPKIKTPGGFAYGPGVYIAFDNRTRCCWVEEFNNPEDAANYCME